MTSATGEAVAAGHGPRAFDVINEPEPVDLPRIGLTNLRCINGQPVYNDPWRSPAEDQRLASRTGATVDRSGTGGSRDHDCDVGAPSSTAGNLVLGGDNGVVVTRLQLFGET